MYWDYQYERKGLMDPELERNRDDYLKIVVKNEVALILNKIVRDIALNYISGLSLDLLSQNDYARLGKLGLKPCPLEEPVKSAVYYRLMPVLLPRLQIVVETIMVPVVRKKLSMLETKILYNYVKFPDSNPPPDFSMYRQNAIDEIVRYKQYEIDADSLKAAIFLELNTFMDRIFEIAKLKELLPPT